MLKKSWTSALLLLLAGTAGLPGEDRFFDSAGVRIHYTVEGNGEAVVLIHGMAFDLAMNWEAPGIVKGLADRYRVVALDVRGHGRSGKPHEPKMYGHHLVADVIRLLDHLKIEKAHIVGCSMGGRIAGALLTEHPERVRTVLLTRRFFPARKDFHAASEVSCRTVDRSAVRMAVIALRPAAVS
jgi:pimeloyl-ACP methyl ester carboxylesterase